MSSFDRPVKVDENGNIDTSMIERELSQALQFDVAYKQKDNMKKKAIRRLPTTTSLRRWWIALT